MDAVNNLDPTKFKSESSIFRLSVLINLLIIVFVPMKFFTFKIASVSLSFTRIFLIFAFLLAVAQISKCITRSIPLGINRNYFDKNMKVFCFYFLVSFIFSILINSSGSYGSRVFFSGISFVESFLVIPLIFFLLVRSASDQLIIFKQCVKIWKFFIYLGFLQVFLDVLGITISYETIGEPAPENTATIFFNYTILRMSSVFNEPRVLAGLVIPIFLFGALSEERRLTTYEIVMIFLVGMLTVSSTFIIAIFVVIAVKAFSRISLRNLILAMGIFFLGTYLLSSLESITSLVTEYVPRMAVLFNLFDVLTSVNLDIASVEGNHIFKGQASDILMIFYILDGNIFTLQGVFGNGLGSNHAVLAQVFEQVFNDTPRDLLGSNILLFSFLIDIGLLGLLILTFFISNIINKAEQVMDTSNCPVRIYCYNGIALSLIVGQSYLVVIFLMFLATMSSIKLNQKEGINS